MATINDYIDVANHVIDARICEAIAATLKRRLGYAVAVACGPQRMVLSADNATISLAIDWEAVADRPYQALEGLLNEFETKLKEGEPCMTSST